MDAPDPTETGLTMQILAQLAIEGFATDLHPAGEGGVLRCSACGSVSEADQFPVASEHRVEGASDPDDLVLIVAATCPVCASGGVVVLGYGPEASSADSDVVASLRTSNRPDASSC